MELHLFASTEFINVFSRIKYSWLLGLTATLQRLDGKHELLKNYAPVFDKISQKEAIQKGWITDFLEFNLAIPITKAEAEVQVKLGQDIRKYMTKFGNSQNAFDNMLNCMKLRNATLYAEKISTKTNEITPKDVLLWALQGMRLVRKRKEFLDTTEHKIRAAAELIKEFNVRTITFSQSTNFAEEVVKLVPEAKAYHTNLESEIRRVEKTKTFKTLNALEKYKVKLQEYEVIQESLTLKWYVPKAFSGKKIADINLDDFLNKKTNVIVTAKALNQGFDDPSIILGICASRTEATTDHIQKTGQLTAYNKLNGET